MERVKISLWRAERTVPVSYVLVQASTIDSWHNNFDLPSRCLFESIPGTTFDRMDVSPLVRSDGGSSSLTVAAVKACSVALDACTTSVAGAVACPARPPSAAAVAPSAIGVTGATLNGFVDDNGSVSTVTFDYGTTPAYGSSVAATPSPIAAGSGVTAVSASLTGLACNTDFHYGVSAVSGGGITTGNNATFRTAACP
jgi:hypothetical protein